MELTALGRVLLGMVCLLGFVILASLVAFPILVGHQADSLETLGMFIISMQVYGLLLLGEALDTINK